MPAPQLAHLAPVHGNAQKPTCLLANPRTARPRDRYRPEVLIICGSGLSGLADDVEEPEVIPYDKCPGFPVNQIHGQASRLIFGKLGGKVSVRKWR